MRRVLFVLGLVAAAFWANSASLAADKAADKPEAAPRAGALGATRVSDVAVTSSQALRPASVILLRDAANLANATRLPAAAANAPGVAAIAVDEIARRQPGCASRAIADAAATPQGAAPLAIDMADVSDTHLDRLQALAAGGSSEALQAYLVLAVHRPDYVPVTQAMLYDAAARGDVMGLITLAQRATSGYGFDRADQRTAIFFEYLAWLGGQWQVPSTADVGEGTFSPSLAKDWSAADLRGAMTMAAAVGCGLELAAGDLPR